MVPQYEAQINVLTDKSNSFESAEIMLSKLRTVAIVLLQSRNKAGPGGHISYECEGCPIPFRCTYVGGRFLVWPAVGPRIPPTEGSPFA